MYQNREYEEVKDPIDQKRPIYHNTKVSGQLYHSMSFDEIFETF